MITLITGAPGSGKTAACVQLLMAFAREGRAIFVDGIPDLKIAHALLDKPKEWNSTVPDGSVIVIDEVQRIWRPSSSGSQVPEDIAALETHRHKGLEFVLMTQHPNLLHSNVRRLVGRHVHIRDNGVLGRWWYEWPEATNPEAWKTAMVKTRYRLPKKTFTQYTSASVHIKPVRKIPMAVIVFLVAIPVIGILATKVYARISGVIDPAKTELAASAQKAPGQKGDTSKKGGVDPNQQKQQAERKPFKADLEYEASLKGQPARLKLVGCIHAGKRCECLDETGFSVEVELKTCLESSRRSGVGVPYAIAPTESKRVSSARPPSESKPTASTTAKRPS